MSDARSSNLDSGSSISFNMSFVEWKSCLAGEQCLQSHKKSILPIEGSNMFFGSLTFTRDGLEGCVENRE